MPWVYMLRCSDDSYYVGNTWHLESRMEQHANGTGAAYTRGRRPVELVFAEEYERVDEAYAREKQIQGWSRAKREALIAREFERLPKLSKRGYRRERPR